MNTETSKRSTLDLTIAARRHKAAQTVADFAEQVAAGRAADAIKWDGVEVIVAEKVVALLDRYVEIRDEQGAETADEYLLAERDNAQRQLGWYDPTSQSTSVSSTMVDQSMFKAHRRLLEVIGELRSSAAIDAEEGR